MFDRLLCSGIASGDRFNRRETIVAVIKLQVMLNERERQFLAYLSEGLKSCPAAVKAGFNGSTYGRRLIRQDHIRSAIAGMANTLTRVLSDTAVR